MNNSTNANGANFDPYLTWLGIRDPQRPPNHYRLLGLEIFENDAEVIAAAADRQMTYVRTYQAGQHGDHSQRILNELTTAKLCLLKPERKRDYDDRLRAAQKPAPLPPMQPPLAAPPPARPLAAMQPQPMQPQPGYPSAAPRPILVQPIPQAAPANVYEDNAPSPFGIPPVRAAVARPAKNNAVMQWSIVGGLVLATIILAVILANKFGGETENQAIANKPTPAKVTPTAAKNPAANKTNNSTAVNATENNPATETVPENTEPKTPATPTSTKNPDEQRPNSGTASLPNTVPGNEEPSTPRPNPMTSVPTNPSPAVTPATPTTPTVATNNDPLSNLPPATGSNPALPQMPANPLNPSTEPPNPLAMPNPLEPDPLTGEMPKPPAPRRPLPTAKEIADSRASVRDVFKSDYASRDTAVLVALGKRLLKTAQESASKPAMMYAVYDEARLVSAQVNDLETTFTAHEELIREFAVDRDKDLLETLKVAAKSAATMNPENAGSVLDIVQESITTAIADNHLDTAEQLLRYVTNFSSRVPDKAAREIAFRDLQKKLGEHKAFALKANQYKETLAKNPSDGDANLELGKFWAFQQGNFEQGLSYLAKGSDSEIREAANRELTLKPDAPDFVKVADAWWEVANKLPTDPRSTVKVHAAYSYARALPNLKALDRGLAESRINEAYKSFKPNNREVKELLKLLLTRTSWKMEWKGRDTLDNTLSFDLSGSCTANEYPTWKLMDNYYVVCFRDPNNDRGGPPSPFGGRFNGFPKGKSKGGGGNNNNNNSNYSGSKAQDAAKNVMQIAVTPNRIDIRVMGNDGELRSTGTGIPE